MGHARVGGHSVADPSVLPVYSEGSDAVAEEEEGRELSYVPDPEDTDPEPTAAAPSQELGEGTEEPPAPEPPATNAPKADWVAYAVAQGKTNDEALYMTKQQLIDEYGH